MIQAMKNRYLIITLLVSLILAACHKEDDLIKEPKVTEKSLEVLSTQATFNWSVDYPGKICSMVEVSLREDMGEATRYGSDAETLEKKFSACATGLTEGTTYYYRYVVWNPMADYKLEVKSFTTKADVPKVKTVEVTDVTRTTAKVISEVTDESGAAVTERGVCWSTDETPTTDDSQLSSGTGTGTYSITLSNLEAGLTYHVRAYAKNEKGTAYGEPMSFTTGDAVKPKVTTTEITDIDWRTATGGGEVTDDGDATVTERGICWSIGHNPEITDAHASSGTGTGSYTVNMTGLTAGTTYFVRAYAKNQVGVGYGNEVSFSAKAPELPTVTTGDVTDISWTTAKCSGNVTIDGGTEVTERGVCWSTDHEPTTNGNHASNGTGLGNYTIGMTGLSDGTTYYVRAYAVNSKGTSYGEERIFTTKAITKPVVTTLSVTDISYSSATGGGNVTDDGGAMVTERGVCWSTGHEPTISGSHASNGTGLGNYAISMTGLSDGTTYYVRAYAKNQAGVGYGDEMSFKSKDFELPIVTTNDVTDISWATAICGGNVTYDGGTEVIERGVCWNTSHNPEITDSHSSNGTGIGNYTVNMAGLIGGTDYYVRAYAQNSVGVSYGNEIHFSTLITPPTGSICGLFTIGVNYQVYFSQGNLQYRASDDIWQFSEHQYDFVGDANSNISSGYSGWIDLFGWGTSGWSSGANCYQPWSTSVEYEDYYPGGSYTNCLTGSYANADWGVYNSISNGGNQAGLWRTLTKDEWVYVFNIRNTNSGIRYAKACVNNVNGVILLPDDWNSAYYSLSSTNDVTADFTSNTFSSSQWDIIEQYGVVFLPAAGARQGTTVHDVGSDGGYWSVSYYSENFNYQNFASLVYFRSNYLEPDGVNNRYVGRSVRLVTPAR